ncbi:MAG: aminoacyl-tRNA deacylase [Candidatus Woesearchaeota archaeon]
MNAYEEKLWKFVEKHSVKAEFFRFEESCHSVKEAAQRIHAEKNDLVKNICFVLSDGEIIVAIVRGNDGIRVSKIREIFSKNARIMGAEEILQRTGYPCGGVPSFGFNTVFLMDKKVMEKEFVYTSGGSENSLIRISTTDLIKLNKGIIANIRK